jgi:hypothetical protein
MMKNRLLILTLGLLFITGLVFTACQENDQPILGVDEPDPNPTGKSAASVSELVPTEGFLKDVVTIKGSGFESAPEFNLVKFGNKVGQVIDASETELSVRAPNISNDTVMVSVAIKGSEDWSNEMSFVFFEALSVIDEEIEWPNGVDVDDAGNIYIGASDDKIVKIAPDASVPVKGAIRFGPQNYLYVCEKWEGKIVRISPDGSSIEDVVEVPDAVSLDWDANGNMYIVSGDYGIFMLDTGGNLTEVASDIGSVKNCRVFGDYLYVSNIWDGVIVRYPLTGSGLGDEEIVVETDSPSAFEFDSEGRMYFAKAWEVDLYTLEPDGSEGEVLYEGQLMTPMRYMTFYDKKMYIVYPGWGGVGMTMSAYIGVEAAPNYGRQ